MQSVQTSLKLTLAALIFRYFGFHGDRGGCTDEGDGRGWLAWLSRVPEPVVAERPDSRRIRDHGRGQRALVFLLDMLLGQRMRHRLYVRSLRLDDRKRLLRPLVVAVSARGARRCMAAGAACSAALAFCATGAASDTDPVHEAAHDDYVEEIIVTADRLEKGAMPTQTIIVQTYNVLRRGKRLYNERRYEEALPYLLIASKRGFKWAQAMTGDIYLQGRGGVTRDIEAGMGWLGVAAKPQTAPRIQTYYRRALAEMSPRQRNHVEQIVDRYREDWSSRDWRVSCRRAVSSSPAAMGVMSLRLNKRMHCAFMDENPVCRLPLGADLSGVMNPVSAPFHWVCPPVTG